jgi:hypothetical protein
MPLRHLPVRPGITRLREQVRECNITPDALAHSYGVPSWTRLELACALIDAIWENDIETVRALITQHPALLNENARGTEQCNWGPTLSYAANVGQNEIVTMLVAFGATDLQHAFERACLRSKLETARLLHTLGARPEPGSVMGPCETLSASGLALQLELGAELIDANRDRLAPLGLVLETYSRNPEGKHGCLEIFAQNGYTLPDTPVFAVHRGRIDLLKAFVKKDPSVLSQQFSHEEIYPTQLGCHADKTLALHGTPLTGGTLLHLCVEDDAFELAQWLLENGADVNAPAKIDADGFGGHTALFGCVVSQAYRCSRKSEIMAKLLLDHGAEINIRASLKKQLRFVDDETEHSYFSVTPFEWGAQFQDQAWVNPSVMALLEQK